MDQGGSSIQMLKNFPAKKLKRLSNAATFTCSKSAIEILEKGVKYVQSLQ